MSTVETNALRDALEAQGLTVRDADGGFAVRARPGRREREATLAADAAASTLPDYPAGDPVQRARAQRADLAAFARGVASWLAEPAISRGAATSFEGAASTLLPTIDRPARLSGFRAASGLDAAHRSVTQELVCTYEFELDDGVRVVDCDQQAAWGATVDRLDRAAVSILFHRSWGMEFVADGDGVSRHDGRDSLDASRLTMLDQSAYDRVRDAAYVAVPATGVLLIADDASDAGAIREAALRVFDASDDPVSYRVWRFERARLLDAPA